MKKIFAMAVLLILVVSASGCVQGSGGGLFSGLMGTGGKTEEAPKDILKIKNIKTVPSPPIMAGTDFSFMFRVENLDDKETARDTSVELYDAGRCYNVERENNKNKCTKNSPCPIFPGGTTLFTWKISAPDNDVLGNMEGTCPLRYKTTYHFDAHTRSEAVVVSEDKIEQASRSGEALTASPTETKSRGPIKIDVLFGKDQPFRSDTIVPFSVVIRNKGSGEVKELTNGKVNISIIGSYGGAGSVQLFNQWGCFEGRACHLNPNPGGGIFTGDTETTNTGGGETTETTNVGTQGYAIKKECRCGCLYPNYDKDSKRNTKDKTIPFLEGETPHIRCFYDFTEMDVDKKTFTVKVDIKDYEYVLEDKKTVTVKPTYEP